MDINTILGEVLGTIFIYDGLFYGVPAKVPNKHQILVLACNYEFKDLRLVEVSCTIVLR